MKTMAVKILRRQSPRPMNYTMMGATFPVHFDGRQTRKIKTSSVSRRRRKSSGKELHYMTMCAMIKPMTQPVETPIKPGIMKLWFRMYLPMRVVPERSKPMHARSDGYVGRKK